MTAETRAVLIQVLCLELTVLPHLKGRQEQSLRKLIWAAQDALRAEERLKNLGTQQLLCRPPEY